MATCSDPDAHTCSALQTSSDVRRLLARVFWEIYQIWEGTAEIQRLVIARELTGRAL
jgi:alkylation response protein AidB-like acyl-CoA dehydrogenase